MACVTVFQLFQKCQLLCQQSNAIQNTRYMFVSCNVLDPYPHLPQVAAVEVSLDFIAIQGKTKTLILDVNVKAWAQLYKK